MPFKIIIILLIIFPQLYKTFPNTDTFRDKQGNKFADIWYTLPS